MLRTTLNYIKIFKIALRSPDVFNPNVVVKTVNDINFDYLRLLGVEFVVFDKDNTLTLTYAKGYFEPGIAEAMQQAKRVMGEANLAVLSNSENKDAFDCDLELNFIPYKAKKPFNFLNVKRHFEKKAGRGDIKNHKVAVVGDRLMTDVLLANLNNAISIYTEPLEKSHEKLTIKVLRKLEALFVRSYKGARREHPSYREPSDVLLRISKSRQPEK